MKTLLVRLIDSKQRIFQFFVRGSGNSVFQFEFFAYQLKGFADNVFAIVFPSDQCRFGETTRLSRGIMSIFLP